MLHRSKYNIGTAMLLPHVRDVSLKYNVLEKSSLAKFFFVQNKQLAYELYVNYIHLCI